MNKNKEFFNNTIVIGILILFVGTILIPSISGDYKNEQDTVSLTFYTFDKTGTKECKVEISTDTAYIISDTFEEFRYKITRNPTSSKTKALKNSLVELLDRYDLIPQGLSRNYVSSLLNPRWLQQIGNNNPYSMDRDLHSKVRNNILPMQSTKMGSAFLCSMAGGGSGLIFTPIMTPRPRLLTLWSSYSSAFSTAANLYTGQGFVASGGQTGIALGFWGIGLSFAFPGEPATFGFGGYALLTLVRADDIETYPLNQVPVISDENPSDYSVDIPVDLSELSFRISDADGDRMNYTVTTNPDIGSSSENNVDNGIYSVDISDLDSNTEYSWRVFVTDGEDTIEEMFSFRTEIEPPFVSDPLPFDGDNWVSVDISELSFKLDDLQDDLMDYTVETVPDIGSSSANDIGDGTYTVDVGGLDYTTDYTWFVNVTDGKYWTRKVFVFKTQPIMVFDPFDEGWLYRKKITINHSQVAGDLFDFPVLISLTDVDLRDKTQFDGDDVLFMDGDGVADRLLHEIEMYDGSNGELVSWVKVPGLSSSEDTVLYLYYGNSGCSNQEYPDMVWDSDFIHVWHLGDNLEDSVGPNNGVDHGTDLVTGKVGMARDFEQTEGDFIDLGDMIQPADGSLTTMTWETWIKPETQDGIIVTKYDTSGPDYNSYYLSFKNGGKFYIHANDQFGPDGRSSGITDDSYSVVDQWIYLTGTFNLGNVQELNGFINGEDVTFTKLYSNANYMRDIPVSDDIGRYRPESGGPKFIDAVIDEMRWSKIVRSNSWIKTSFNTMNDPSGFFSVGPEESSP